jgi:hypothetical protein
MEICNQGTRCYLLLLSLFKQNTTKLRNSFYLKINGYVSLIMISEFTIKLKMFQYGLNIYFLLLARNVQQGKQEVYSM